MYIYTYIYGVCVYIYTNVYVCIGVKYHVTFADGMCMAGISRGGGQCVCALTQAQSLKSTYFYMVYVLGHDVSDFLILFLIFHELLAACSFGLYFWRGGCEDGGCTGV